MIAAVVLAAGAATRFGRPKQALLLDAVLERVRASAAVERIVVVAGAYALEVSDAASDTSIALCPDWRRGPGASLRCGLAALPPETEAAVVVLADGPDLSPAAIDRVVDAWRREPADVVGASYGSERGHPLLVARRAFGEVPDEGLRARETRLVPCDDLGSPGDVDYETDLPERFRNEAAEPMEGPWSSSDRSSRPVRPPRSHPPGSSGS